MMAVTNSIGVASYSRFSSLSCGTSAHPSSQRTPAWSWTVTSVSGSPSSLLQMESSWTRSWNLQVSHAKSTGTPWARATIATVAVPCGGWARVCGKRAERSGRVAKHMKQRKGNRACAAQGPVATAGRTRGRKRAQAPIGCAASLPPPRARSESPSRTSLESIVPLAITAAAPRITLDTSRIE